MNEMQNNVVSNENGQTEQVVEPVQENNQSVETTQNSEAKESEQQTKEIEDNEQKEKEVETKANNPEDLQKRLKEYELKEDEIRQLASRVGVDDVENVNVFKAQTQMDILNNQIMQEYINLCSQYGVDYRPEKIDESSKKLFEEDRNKYYDLQYKLGQLDQIANAKRQEINNYIYNTQLQSSLAKYKQVLDSSPAINEALNSFMQYVPHNNPAQSIQGFMNLAAPLYKEAFEYGKLYAQQQAIEAKNTPEMSLNNNSIVQGSDIPIPSTSPLTLDDIAKMDSKTFQKNLGLIEKLRAEGRLK